MSSSIGSELIPLINRLQDIFCQASAVLRIPRDVCASLRVVFACDFVSVLRDACAFVALFPRRGFSDTTPTLETISQAGLQKSLSLPLPQVAVVGSQSSGKSSVLEALVRPSIPPRAQRLDMLCLT